MLIQMLQPRAVSSPPFARWLILIATYPFWFDLFAIVRVFARAPMTVLWAMSPAYERISTARWSIQAWSPQPGGPWAPPGDPRAALMAAPW